MLAACVYSARTSTCSQSPVIFIHLCFLHPSALPEMNAHSLLNYAHLKLIMNMKEPLKQLQRAEALVQMGCPKPMPSSDWWSSTPSLLNYQLSSFSLLSGKFSTFLEVFMCLKELEEPLFFGSCVHHWSSWDGRHWDQHSYSLTGQLVLILVLMTHLGHEA